MRTGLPIVYTSADSVLQIAAHEEVIPLPALYEMCLRTACALRRMAHRPGHRPALHRRSRDHSSRTANRRDFSMLPPGRDRPGRPAKGTAWTRAAIGKIENIFAGRGIGRSRPSHGNAEGMRLLREEWAAGGRGLVFANLVDFDMLYGHRNDAAGYGAALEAFDRELGALLPELGRGDMLIITADHGCDPAFPAPTTPGSTSRSWSTARACRRGLSACGRRSPTSAPPSWICSAWSMNSPDGASWPICAPPGPRRNHGHYERIMEAVGFIKERCPLAPKVGVVLGSGLGEFADRVAEACAIPYADIPHFKPVSVAGHAGRLVLGKVGGVPVAVCRGAIHYYEGHDIGDVVFPVRVLAKLGVTSLLLTNAAGGINRELQARGPDDHPRPHQPDGRQSAARPQRRAPGAALSRHERRLRPGFQEIIAAALAEIGRPARRGVYLALSGPSYETPAEIRMLAALGADAVGMSTVPEAICRPPCGLARGRHLLHHQPGRRHLGAALEPRRSDRDGRAGEERFHRLLKLVIPRLA